MRIYIQTEGRLVKMAKIKRKELKTFINTTYGTTDVYELLGADLEEFIVAMNMEVEATKNILGGSSINITQGNKTAAVEPYYADTGTGLFKVLQEIINEDKELDQLITDIVNVEAWETPDGANYPAYKDISKIEIVSAGGNTVGYQIPFNLHLTGDKELGAFNPTTLVYIEGTWSSQVSPYGTFTPTP